MTAYRYFPYYCQWNEMLIFRQNVMKPSTAFIQRYAAVVICFLLSDSVNVVSSVVSDFVL